MATDKQVVFFPVTIHADPSKTYLRKGFTSMFVSRLAGGGIEVIDEGQYGTLLSDKEKEGVISRDRAEELTRKLGAEYAVFGSVTTLGEGYSLDFSVLDLKKGNAELTRISEVANEDQLILTMADVAYQFRAVIEAVPLQPRKRTGLASMALEPEANDGLFVKARGPDSSLQPSGEVSMNLALMAFDIGDLDGDGLVEWVVLGRDKLLVYVKDRGTMVLKGRLEPSYGEKFLKVSVGDGDENGKAEIYLVSQHGERVRTGVWEWETEKFQNLYRRGGHLRILNRSDNNKPLLLFQDSGLREVFKGKISFMEYDQEGKLTRQESLEKLKGLQFYTLTVLDMDRDGQMEFIGLNKDSYLLVWDSEGNKLWYSDKALGGTNNAIGTGYLSDEYTSPNDPEFLVLFNSRMVIMDIDGDGKQELLAVKNIPSLGALGEYRGSFKSYDKAKLNAYKINGRSLVPAWTSKEFDLSISDMQTDGRTLFLAKLKPQATKFSKGKGGIAWFD
jgi:TolB-like protein